MAKFSKNHFFRRKSWESAMCPVRIRTQSRRTFDSRRIHWTMAVSWSLFSQWTTASFDFHQMAVHKRTTMLAHCNLKQNAWFCSKQSSFFSLYALPSGGNWKTRWSIAHHNMREAPRGCFEWNIHVGKHSSVEVIIE